LHIRRELNDRVSEAIWILGDAETDALNFCVGIAVASRVGTALDGATDDDRVAEALGKVTA
jgi:hypothetical protein